MNIHPDLIAPCGMNCALCVAYQFKAKDLNKLGYHKTYCPGCIPRGRHCTFTGGLCEQLANGTVRFCYECEQFPCLRLKRLDKRYRTKYDMSMIANNKMIKAQGIDAFLARQAVNWACPACGEIMCTHMHMCLDCNKTKLAKKPKRNTK
jgi:hypothetical protein